MQGAPLAGPLEKRYGIWGRSPWVCRECNSFRGLHHILRHGFPHPNPKSMLAFWKILLQSYGF